MTRGEADQLLSLLWWSYLTCVFKDDLKTFWFGAMRWGVCEAAGCLIRAVKNFTRNSWSH